MPRLPIDYSKTIIYKICCNDVNVNEIYVGHSTDLVRRRQEHKDCCINEKRKQYKCYKYQFIRDNGGWDNWSLVPVEEFPCENVNQAKIRERYWIETLQAELNKQIPTRNQQEYNKDNKEKINQIKKEYREENKEKIKEKDRKYREENKDKIKEKKKEYYETNKEKKKEYHENNKEKINEKKKEKFTCECGTICRIGDKARHFKSKKHQDYLTTVDKDRQESAS